MGTRCEIKSYNLENEKSAKSPPNNASRKEQKKLVEQLMASVSGPTTTSSTMIGPAGPPTRRLLAHCLTTLFRDVSDLGTT